LTKTATFATTYQNTLLRIPIIRSFLAGALLVLFAFSITPTRWLHNAVATHKDGRSGLALPFQGKAQLGKATINCQYDDFIAESPFLHYDTATEPFIPVVYSDYQDQRGDYFISSDSFCFGLRGPPVSQM